MRRAELGPLKQKAAAPAPQIDFERCAVGFYCRNGIGHPTCFGREEEMVLEVAEGSSLSNHGRMAGGESGAAKESKNTTEDAVTIGIRHCVLDVAQSENLELGMARFLVMLSC